MKHFIRTTAAAALILSLACPAPAPAAEPRLPRDGWVSWQAPAVAGAPNWCCFSSWDHGEPSSMSCRLDSGLHGYGVHDGDATTDTVTIYARTAGGKLDRLQALSSSCPVETKTPVQKLGDVTPEDSVRWLEAQARREGAEARNERSIGENALAALALHRGDLARDGMARFTRDARVETRKKAVFWLSMVRGEEGAGMTSSVMFGDPSPDVRQHAAFALSQSDSPRAAPDLVRLGNTDKVDDVRGKAWFWLAQTGAADAESAIGAALKKDPSEGVREEAVFALSQLPDERAARALIAAAEDPSLSREQRKRAVFWLSQSDSDAALAYLDRVLTPASR